MVVFLEHGPRGFCAEAANMMPLGTQPAVGDVVLGPEEINSLISDIRSGFFLVQKLLKADRTNEGA